MIDIKNLTVKTRQKTILHKLNFHLSAGDWLMIIGPNGAGKTSLLKTLSTSLPFAGEIQLMGRNIHAYPSKERAQNIGFLAQQHASGLDFSVREIVELGRYAYTKGWLGHLSEEDQAMITDVMQVTEIGHLAEQRARHLSGGELQRTFLAQVLAQDPNVLALDEPTNHLDIYYEQSIFSIVNQWLQEERRAVISIVHDLSLAKQYGTHALLLDEGQQIAYGTIEEVLTHEYLNQVYQTDVFAYMKNKYKQWF